VSEGALWSYAAGGVLFLVLTVLLVVTRPGRAQGRLLAAAAAASTAWCALLAAQAGWGVPSLRMALLAEVGRTGFWLAFLLGVLRYSAEGEGRRSAELRLIGRVVVGLCAASAALVLAGPHLAGRLGLQGGGFWLLFGHLLLAVAGLALVEQLYRNTRAEHRWAIKYLCLGVGGLFAYDLYLYSDALLLKRLSPDLWGARGAVNAIIVPLIAVAVSRNPQWSTEIFVSRHIVFHSAAVLGAGVYLMLMAAAGYYIRAYGGSWGGLAQTAFLFAALLLLLALMSSGQIRSRGKVFLAKHFFKNKYDYREEWLRFAHTLSTSTQDRELRENIVRAVAEIVESPGGVMWVRGDDGHYRPAAWWRSAPPEAAVLTETAPLVEFLERRGWVVYLDELARDPGRYPGLELPGWLQRLGNPWIVVPLLHREELLGFTVLQRSSTKHHLNWEDTDLLKTVGREAASYIAVLKLSEALADARQFETFNRLSAYVVHDLKNLVGQLTLVVSNARKHGHNPEFMADAIETVEHATEKMNRLLAQLRKGRWETGAQRRVDLQEVLERVVRARAAAQPVPALDCEDAGLAVEAEPERLAAVVEHIVQNAQEATPEDGRVQVRLRREADWALVEVEDSGCGMDERFIAERLFRPFDTTKGNAGMGIGVYESREFLRALGGDIAVQSQPGRGTRFRFLLPLAGSRARLQEAEVEVAG